MLHDGTANLNYSYDQENRITGAAGFIYTYDADGNRVEKANGGNPPSGTLYWYMTPGIVGESVNEVVDAVSNGLNVLSNASSTLVNKCTCQEPKSEDNNKQNNNSKSDNQQEQGGSKSNPDRTSNDPLRRDANGKSIPDPEAEGVAHTQLGTKTSKSQAGNPKYGQGMEFDKNGTSVRRLDQTNHGRSDHPNPQEH
jgi:hypothetical protein